MFHRSHGCRPARRPVKIFARRHRHWPACSDWLALPIFRDRRQWVGQADKCDAGKIPCVFAAIAETKGGANHHPLYVAGRRSRIAAGCEYSNASGPNSRVSAGSRPGARVRFEIGPFDAGAGIDWRQPDGPRSWNSCCWIIHGSLRSAHRHGRDGSSAAAPPCCLPK
jgi:hypothetical protein